MLAVTVLFIVFIFLAFRSRSTLAPSNIVFLNYLLYLIFPSCLYFLFELFQWEYVLPWGKIHNWSEVSFTAIFSYLYVFCTFFFFVRLLENRSAEVGREEFFCSYKVRPKFLLFYALLILCIGVFYVQKTAGFNAWLFDYQTTYLTKKKGYGLLNFLLLHGSNLLAFIFGFYFFTEKRKSIYIVLPCLFVLLFFAYIQGIKSRVFFFGLMFFVPALSYLRVSLAKGVLIFIGFILLNMIGMYFRSDGFYSTFSMQLEYILSYFNTIFLHDMVLRDFESGLFTTMQFPINKLLTFLGVPSESQYHDISRWLTSIYFSDQWFSSSATQQWPIETEFYLNYGYMIFWIVPIFWYSLYIATMFNLRYKLGPVFLFIYLSELLRFLSIFRGSMFDWIIFFSLPLYVLMYFGGRLVFRRVELSNE